MQQAILTGNHVVSQIREYLCQDAVIAGGWARDYIMGGQIKDVDIWCSELLQKHDLLALFPNMTDYQYFDVDIDERLQGVCKFKLEGIQVDIISYKPEVLSEGESITDTFDFGICQAYSFGDCVVHGTSMFWDDFHKHRITYNKTPYNDRNIKRITDVHLPRLKRKFPGYGVFGCNVPKNTAKGKVGFKKNGALPKVKQQQDKASMVN